MYSDCLLQMMGVYSELMNIVCRKKKDRNKSILRTDVIDLERRRDVFQIWA